MRGFRNWLVLAVITLAVVAAAIAVAVVRDPPHGSTAQAPEAAASGREASASSLPARNVVGYWQGWGAPNVPLRDVPRQFNIVMAAFAVGDATGRVRFTQTVQSRASFVADVDALSRAGRRVVLSVGGWNDGGLTIASDAQQAAFLDSVTAIIDAYHFHGIDWDFEHGLNPARLADITFQLKAKYGPRFLITMAPTLDPAHERQQFDLGARIKNVVDMVNIQFYNHPNLTPKFMLDRTLSWGKVVGMAKVGMGFMTVQTPTDTGIRTPAAVCAMWRSLLTRAPEARGVMTWSINLDRTTGHRFARTCAPVVLSES